MQNKWRSRIQTHKKKKIQNGNGVKAFQFSTSVIFVFSIQKEKTKSNNNKKKRTDAYTAECVVRHDVRHECVPIVHGQVRDNGGIEPVRIDAVQPDVPNKLTLFKSGFPYIS